ncbi:hypothetical protein DIPPA_08082 [Diplonema papillatum]|nr:hypothetical protein DIPPA_08082 [Diplonema papillatum]
MASFPPAQPVPEIADETKSMFAVVNDELTKNLQAFMDNLPELTAKYSRFLEATKSLNPKAAMRKGTGPVSPLLKCHKSSSALNYEGMCESPLDLTPKRPTNPVETQDPSAEELLESAANNTHQDDPKLFLKNFDEPTGDPAKLPPLPEDPLLSMNMDSLTRETYELHTILSGICDWIEMQMPAIRLEDNRGVIVQESVIRHLIHMRTSVQGVNGRQNTYARKVADCVSKYYKEPLSAKEYAKGLIKHNMDTWDQLERDWRDVRQVVILAGRLLSLNLDKLQSPHNNPTVHGMNYM